jgi:hypothetical protein
MPAHASAVRAAAVWVEVSPTTITAGFEVGLRADCADNSNSATVNSKAFGQVTLQPLNSLLQAEVRVPESTPPGGYDVTLTCRTGATATTTLWVIHKNANAGTGTIGPHTGGGFLAGTRARLPHLRRLVTGPTAWLAGAMAALLAAGAVGAASVRRPSVPRPSVRRPSVRRRGRTARR